MVARLLGLLTICLSIAACAEPPPAFSPARQALVEHTPGPILAEVHGPMFGLARERRDAVVTDELARAVSGLRVSFTTDPALAVTTDPRLVVLLNPVDDPPPALACREPEGIAIAPPGAELALLAVFCRGDEPLGVARQRGPAPALDTRPAQRLLWRTATQLFPDDYPHRYGFNIIPGIHIGVGGTFGF